MRKPFRPSETPSEAQLPAMSTEGRKQAAASRTTSPFVSKVEGKRKRSLRQYQARMVSLSLIAPVKRTRSVRPSFSAYARTAGPSAPPPMKTMRKSAPFAARAASASRMMRRPLYHMSRPTNRNTGTPSGRSYPAVTARISSAGTRSRGTSTPFSIMVYSPS